MALVPATIRERTPEHLQEAGQLLLLGRWVWLMLFSFEGVMKCHAQECQCALPDTLLLLSAAYYCHV